MLYWNVKRFFRACSSDEALRLVFYSAAQRGQFFNSPFVHFGEWGRKLSSVLFKIVSMEQFLPFYQSPSTYTVNLPLCRQFSRFWLLIILCKSPRAGQGSIFNYRSNVISLLRGASLQIISYTDFHISSFERPSSVRWFV